MKLFTKDIDKKLFKQYPLGSDLSQQKVIAKIFNPYGNYRWYIINSDPDDPDYLWAIVQNGSIVEIGSVSRNELESIRVSPFRLPLERDLSFREINAEEAWRNIRSGNYMKRGGSVDEDDNKGMILNQVEGMEHHVEELEEAAKKAKEVPAWVVAKSQRASTDLSDITHYLDGENEQREEEDEGEEMARGGVVKMIPEGEEYRYQGRQNLEKDILAKIEGQINDMTFAGNFEIRDKEKSGTRITEGYLYELDDYDKIYLVTSTSVKLKPEEKVFRYYTRTTAIGGMMPLIKINIEKGLAYFPIYHEEKDSLIGFERKSTPLTYLNLTESASAYEKMEKGGITGDLHSLTDKLLSQKIQMFLEKVKPIKYYYIDDTTNMLVVGFDENYTQDAAYKFHKAATSSVEFFDADSVDMEYDYKTNDTKYFIKLKRDAKFAVGGFLLGAAVGALGAKYLLEDSEKSAKTKEDKSSYEKELTWKEEIQMYANKDGFDYAINEMSGDVKDYKFNQLKKDYLTKSNALKKHIEANEVFDEEDNIYVEDTIEKEGFDYALSGYHDWKGVKDKKFQSLYADYKTSKKNLSKYVGIKDKYEDGGMMAMGGEIIKPSKPIEKMTKQELMQFVSKINPLKHFYPKTTQSGRVQAKKIYEEYVSKKSMAKGGMTEHGLRAGDKILSGKVVGTTIRVRNENFDEDAKIDLETGERTVLIYDKKTKKYIEKKEGGGYFEKEGDLLKEGDFVYKADGQKARVEEVTDDEYYLYSFMQSSPKPFSKKKVDDYIKTGFWSMKPKSNQMAMGGEITVKVGDKVKSKKGIEGEVYESTGTMFKLKDKYGGKSTKWHSTKDFKKSEILSMAKGGETYDKFDKIKERYGSGRLGNGLTFWDREIEENRDYKIIAHTSPEGVISYYDKKLPKNVVEWIEYETKKEVEHNKMAKGGATKSKYTVIVHHGGEMDDEVFHTDSLKQAKEYAFMGEQSEIYDNELNKEVEVTPMAMGGVTFEDKVQSIKRSLLERKKVSPAVQKDYGKTYSPEEAEESARRIAGAQRAKYELKKIRFGKGKKSKA